VHRIEWKTDMPGVVLMRLTGSIDMMSFPDIRQNFLDILNSGVSRVALDMAGVYEIDSSGIGLLIKTSATLQNHGGDLCLFGLRPRIRKLFQIARLDSRITVHEDEAATAKHFSDFIE